MECVKAALTCMVNVKAAMDQFLKGLDMGGVEDYIKSHMQLLKPLFHKRLML